MFFKSFNKTSNISAIFLSLKKWEKEPKTIVLTRLFWDLCWICFFRFFGKYFLSKSKKLSFFTILKFLIPLSLQTDSINLWYFKLRLFDLTELKTLKWNILNPNYVIWVSNVHTFDFLLKQFFLDIVDKNQKPAFLN